MTRFLFTPRALEDFDQILNYIGNDNSQAAARLGEDILRLCNLLESHPKMGERKDELAPGMRCIMCRGYALYYRINEENQTVRLLRVLHPSLNVWGQSFD